MSSFFNGQLTMDNGQLSIIPASRRVFDLQ